MSNGQGPQGAGPSILYGSGTGGLDPAQRLRQAFLLHQQGRLEEASSLYRELLAVHPDNAHALHLLGVLHAQRSDYSAAAHFISRAVALDPDNPSAFYNLGNTLRDLKRLDDALANYDRALALRPTVEAWGNRGAVLQELGRPNEAIASFDRALAMNPSHATSFFNRGNALRDLYRHEEALADYDRALALKPNHADAHNGRGSILQDFKRFDEAFAAYDRAFSFDPDLPYLEGWRLLSKMHCCDWSHSNDEVARLSRHVEEGKFSASPYVLLATDFSARRQMAAAQMYARDKYPAPSVPLWQGEKYEHDKIRVGYVSGEFHEQATAYLTADLFECHDRAAFATYGFATGKNDHSAMRNRLERAFNSFVDVSGRTDRDIAEIIRRSEIDILVNLNGYFGGERTGVFALRPAPLQVNYLGYPGTMGASYIDYIIADKIVIAEDEHPNYAENVVYLPDSYQPNDRKKPIGEGLPRRSECGLPENGLVFCCFNNSFKITPHIFDIWMRLLAQTENSVLWFLEWNAAVRRNLVKEAVKRGIAADRIKFAPLMKLEDHLARLRVADVFLDTLPHNAHTTASDALWCGVPVLTCLGSTFAGRVAASLLQAVGLDEMITHSLEEYETLALKLARNPEQLAALKARLAENRNACALFDTPRYARNLETAYRAMWKRQQHGEPPASFSVGGGGDGQ